MTTPAMTDQQLIDYSGEHLMHELSMLWELAEILPQRTKGTAEYVALLESFAIHLRNLIEFFCFVSEGDYVRAQEFFDDPSAWPARSKLTPNLKDALRRANEEVSHLTTGRISGSPPEKAWDTTALLTEIGTVAREFATKASAKKLHSKVVEFLKLPANEVPVWLGDNVSHSNVSSSSMGIVSVSPVANNSTHTQIVGHVLIKQP
jgi:hypothetical protein